MYIEEFKTLFFERGCLETPISKKPYFFCLIFLNQMHHMFDQLVDLVVLL